MKKNLRYFLAPSKMLNVKENKLHRSQALKFRYNQLTIFAQARFAALTAS